MAERTKAIVSAVVVLAVNVAALLGYQLDESVVSQCVSMAAVIAATAYALWKNHNFTDAAAQAQAIMAGLKADADADELAEVAKAHGDNRGE